MKKLIIILTLFILTIFINAQDSIYIQFKYDFMNLEVPVIKEIEYNEFIWKPAVIVLATFVINQAIIMHDEKNHNFQNTSKKTGIVFLIGGTACTLTYSFEMKKRRNFKKVWNGNK